MSRLANTEMQARWNSIVWSAGHRTETLYAFFPEATHGEDAGFFFSEDDGETWEPCRMSGVDSEIIDIAAHPDKSNVVAITTLDGLFVSTNNGNSFTMIDNRTAETVAFDLMNPYTIIHGNSIVPLYNLPQEQPRRSLAQRLSAIGLAVFNVLPRG